MTRNLWLALMGLTILGGVVLPYGPLAGSALVVPFWLGFGLLVMALIALAVARWRV